MKRIAHITGTHTWDPIQIALAVLVALAIMATAAGNVISTSANIPPDFDRPAYETASSGVESVNRERSTQELESTRDGDSDYSEGEAASQQFQMSKPALNDIWLDGRQLEAVSRLV